MFRRLPATALALAAFFTCAACGGGPRSTSAELATIPQPTPDPTLDAVVRDLPRALAGVVAPTPTPTPLAAPRPKPASAVVTSRPTPRPPTPTRTRR